MMNGSVLRWIANLGRFEEPLAKYPTLYVGHGPAADSSLIQRQRQYFDTACAALLDATAGTAELTDDSRKKYQQAMLAKYPDYGFTLTVGFSADALAKELAGIKNYDWRRRGRGCAAGRPVPAGPSLTLTPFFQTART